MTAAAAAAIGYQPAGLDVHGRRCRESWHAVATGGPVRHGLVIRQPGEALCGAGPLGQAPLVLFPAVTCQTCRAIAACEHIEITGGQL